MQNSLFNSQSRLVWFPQYEHVWGLVRHFPLGDEVCRQLLATWGCHLLPNRKHAAWDSTKPILGMWMVRQWSLSETTSQPHLRTPNHRLVWLQILEVTTTHPSQWASIWHQHPHFWRLAPFAHEPLTLEFLHHFSSTHQFFDVHIFLGLKTGTHFRLKKSSFLNGLSTCVPVPPRVIHSTGFLSTYWLG